MRVHAQRGGGHDEVHHAVADHAGQHRNEVRRLQHDGAQAAFRRRCRRPGGGGVRLAEEQQQHARSDLQHADGEHRSHVRVRGNPSVACRSQQRAEERAADRAEQHCRDRATRALRRDAFGRGKAVLLDEGVVDAVQADAGAEPREAAEVESVGGNKSGGGRDGCADDEAEAAADAPHQHRRKHRRKRGAEHHDRQRQRSERRIRRRAARQRGRRWSRSAPCR